MTRVAPVAFLISAVLCSSAIAQTPEAAERLKALQKRMEDRQKAATRATTNPATAAEKTSRRVVYLIDRSGTNAKRYIDMVDDVGKAIESLDVNQHFAVVILANDKALTYTPALVAATDEHKRRAYNFVHDNSTPAGVDAMVAAMPAIVKLQPDVVWFISDGDYNKPDEVEKAVTKAAALRFRVNTTLKAAGERATPEMVAVLTRIAAATGGICVGAEGSPISLTPATSVDKPLEQLRELPKGESPLKE